MLQAVASARLGPRLLAALGLAIGLLGLLASSAAAAGSSLYAGGLHISTGALVESQ
jgi:hypothetical protein